MIFANGDCYITYQQPDPIDSTKRVELEKAFEEGKHVYLNSMITTEHTLTFYYSPIKVMEEQNTIEPDDIIIGEVREFLRGMEFSI